MFGKVYHVSSNLLDAGFKQIDFHGISCSIPVNYDNYLTAIFGDWRTPKLDWVEDDSPAMQDDYRGQVPEDRRFMHKKNADAAIELLKIVSKVMDKYDIKFYLDFGTLLGAVRDDGLMPWDDDIDISIIDEKDFFKLPKVMAEIKKQYGYSTNTYTFRHSQEVYNASEKMYVKPKRLEFTDVDNYQVGIIKTDKQWIPGIGNVIMDIFCKYEYEEYSYCMMFGKEYRIPFSPLRKGFKQIDFHGVACLIPTAYDEYLTSIFGDWRIPKLDWVEDDCPALVDK
jgi:phosphorylcholine metabolism protein LicD